MAVQKAMYSSEHQDWNTPACVLERVRAVAPIALDPCSNAQSIVHAKTEWRLTRGDDGLRLDWRGHGLVFVNPPYGRELRAWMARMDLFGGQGVEIIALIPHRTDHAAYHDHTTNLVAKCEWRGRLRHTRGIADSSQAGLFGADAEPLEEPDNGAAFPSALLYWGASLFGRFRRAFESAGKIWVA